MIRWKVLFSRQHHSAQSGDEEEEKSHLGLQVRPDSDDASLHGHLEGEADHPSDLQQSLLTLTPATLTGRRKRRRKQITVTRLTSDHTFYFNNADRFPLRPLGTISCGKLE